MCGIAGFWNRKGNIASEVLLERMLDRISYRGPDDRGTWADGAVAIGHCRLSILDLSTKGHQPFMTSDRQGVLSYNGEVYNYLELKGELEKENIRFSSATDTEVVLNALHLWGPEKAVLRFNGMFAFAYFDQRTHTLWLARDKTGIKPLYIAEQGDTILFASEMKALLAHPMVPCKPDMHALTTHLLTKRLIGSWTPFENIKNLPSGTLMKITADKKETITYFDVLRDVSVDRILQEEKSDLGDLVLRFEKYFRESVKGHLVSDAPLAAMCSGGVDSSLMTAYARDFKPDLVAYVADIKEVGIPEGAKAKRVCDHLNIELRQVDVGGEEFLRLWPEAVYANDQPCFFPQNIPFFAVTQAARRDGFKVLLTGEGSDELFGGYAWHVDAYRMWRARRIHSKFVPNVKPLRILGRYLSRITPLNMKDLEKKPFTHLTRETISAHDIRSACGIDAGQRFFLEEALFKKLSCVPLLEDRALLASCHFDFYCQLPTLLRCNDKMGMSNSVEARVPFLENRLIDFGLHLPRKAKYQQGITKWVVKKAAEKRLPRDIVHARKIGFGVSNTLWRRGVPLLEAGVVSDLFKWGSEQRESILPLALKDDSLLYHLVSMELWARIFLRGESPGSLSNKLVEIDRVRQQPARKKEYAST